MFLGGIVIVLPPDVIVFTPFEVVTRGGILGLLLAGDLETGGFFTGIALGTDSTLLSDFLRLRVMPPFIFKTSVSGLKLSISTFPSSKVSPFFSHTPLFLALSKIEKYH